MNSVQATTRCSAVAGSILKRDGDCASVFSASMTRITPGDTRNQGRQPSCVRLNRKIAGDLSRERPNSAQSSLDCTFPTLLALPLGRADASKSSNPTKSLSNSDAPLVMHLPPLAQDLPPRRRKFHGAQPLLLRIELPCDLPLLRAYSQQASENTYTKARCPVP